MRTDSKSLIRQLVVLTDADLIIWNKDYYRDAVIWRCRVGDVFFDLDLFVLRVKCGPIMRWLPISLLNAVHRQAARADTIAKSRVTAEAFDAVDTELRALLSPAVVE